MNINRRHGLAVKLADKAFYDEWCAMRMLGADSLEAHEQAGAVWGETYNLCFDNFLMRAAK